jgi:hypothetical protein
MIWSNHNVIQKSKPGLRKRWFPDSEKVRVGEADSLLLVHILFPAGCSSCSLVEYVQWMEAGRGQPLSASKDIWDLLPGDICLLIIYVFICLWTLVKYIFEGNALIFLIHSMNIISWLHALPATACSTHMWLSMVPPVRSPHSSRRRQTPTLYKNKNQCLGTVLIFKMPSSSENENFIIYF